MRGSVGGANDGFGINKRKAGACGYAPGEDFGLAEASFSLAFWMKWNGKECNLFADAGSKFSQTADASFGGKVGEGGGNLAAAEIFKFGDGFSGERVFIGNGRNVPGKCVDVAFADTASSAVFIAKSAADALGFEAGDGGEAARAKSRVWCPAAEA